MNGTHHYHSASAAAYGDPALGHVHENSPMGHTHISIAPKATIGRWCAHHRDWHVFITGACWLRDDHPERFAETRVGIPCTFTAQRGGGDRCYTEASEEIYCGDQEGFRTFCTQHATRMRAYYRNLRQRYGREAGHQIAVDALVALATAPYPAEFIDGFLTSEEVVAAKKDFDQAARRELLKTIQESIAAS